MTNSDPNVYRTRLNFGKINTLVDPPELLQIQKDSFEWFLQKGSIPEQRKNQGLEAVFRSVFPFTDYGKSCKLEYLYYRLGEPKYDPYECKTRGMTYAAPMRVSLRLILFERGEGKENRRVLDVKEQEIYFGEFPLMTDAGSFVVNGTERVIVSQLHKSPGVFFSHDKGKTHASNKLLYFGGIIPQRGAWLDFEFDGKDILYAKIDRKRKFIATILLKALGYGTQELLKRFYKTETFNLEGAFDKEYEAGRVYSKNLNLETIVNQRLTKDVPHPKTGEPIALEKRKFTKAVLKKLQEAGVKIIPVSPQDLLGRYSLNDVKDENGNLIVGCNQPITEGVLEKLLEHKVANIETLYIGPHTIGSALRDTLAMDKVESVNEALLKIYGKMKPGDPPTLEVAKTMLNNMFFAEDRFDLSKVGRMKMNKKLGLNKSLDDRTLDNEDILKVVHYLLYLKEGDGVVDDIDHLGNRRVRSVGELLDNRFRTGLVRMERAVKERMSLQETDQMMLHDIVNSKPITAVINEFFCSSQLSQFLDQTNPLAEITHKRRLSALGPGGLTRERAGFEVRDVHPSHYGRICPVETPEGPNIGLISSLATYSKLNEFGFIETPYLKVENGRVTREMVYHSAIEDGNYKIAQANSEVDGEGYLKEAFVSAREAGEFKSVSREEIELIDLSPQQLVSVGASIIPFLEHDDANRALMGANMQRQAVPLVKPEAPLVGTGMEFQVAHDSGSCVISRCDGVVEKVEADRIVVRSDRNLETATDYLKAFVEIHHLKKYQRPNQNTCINNTPLVKPGDRVKKNQILADSSCTEAGELALGQNMLVAFMTWNGFNYEDSIIVSEKVLKEERFTSIHIEEYEALARDTKLGMETITRDLPNANDHSLRNLDSCGIVRIGSYVKYGDVLVGKTTPKGESQLNPEEKLLRAIFGDKAGDVKDSSLRVPQGVEGVVTDVKVFNRRMVEKDRRTKEIEEQNLRKIENDFNDEMHIVKKNLADIVYPLIKGRPLSEDLLAHFEHVLLHPKGTVLTYEQLMAIPETNWSEIRVRDENVNARLEVITQNATEQFDLIHNLYEQKKDKELRIEDLQPGVIRSIKVFIAVKRRLSVGDKMAGRHGNKGVISKIVPVEDMPYTEDGRIIDVILNPLGVPSRMNVGQVLETHLGLAAKTLGEKIDAMMVKARPVAEIRDFIKQIYDSPFIDRKLDEMDEYELREFAGRLRQGVHVATPVFDGAEEKDLHRLMRLCGLEETGKIKLFDGRTGEAFDQKVAVGYMYVLKLYHLVDDKIHARSIGPYSMVTQQPLGGKAQFGGQRFGEMEVWALEAYGAAYTLRELLTVKSDDIAGRNRIYESIVKGKHESETYLPESFKVLINEMKSLCLEFKLIKDTRFIGEDG